MRLEIDDEWFIDAEMDCVTLYQRVVTKPGPLTKPENIGKIRESAQGYFSTVRDALIKCINKTAISASAKMTMEEYLSAVDDRILRVVELADRIAPHVPGAIPPKFDKIKPRQPTTPVVPSPVSEVVQKKEPVFTTKTAAKRRTFKL